MRKALYTLLILLVTLTFSLDAKAQYTKSQLNSQTSASFPNNTTGEITPAIVVTQMDNYILSWVDWLTCTGTGGMLYWSSGTPTCLTIGTTGQQLIVTGGIPAWGNTAIGNLANINNQTIVSNISGISAAPSQNSLSALMDNMLGASQGSIPLRGASSWSILTVCPANQQIVSNGTTFVCGAGVAQKSNVQTFTSSNTWTKPSGYGSTANVHIQVWGAGGSGGRSQATAPTASGGGGGGGYNEIWVPLSSLGSTVTVTVGTGGAAVTTGVGNAGGTSSFGSLLSAYGGGGGGIDNNTSVSGTGGGGGGQLTAGATGPATPGSAASTCPGQPILGYTGNCNTASGAGDTGAGTAVPGFWSGGGGGGDIPGSSVSAGLNSVMGGAGGGAVGSGSGTSNGGTSQYGGNGGAAGSTGGSAGTAGTQPGGGGGGSLSTSGAGAAGQVIVTVYDGT
jgi:hypothetical protein